MAKHDALTPKAVANKIKAKGLQKLRWYCQMCEKQCRDQNGFKCHCLSESHQRQMAIFAENPKRFLEQFSQEFEAMFIATLSRRYGTKQVHANQVYQEIVADRQHLHMNATKWATLSEFVMYLGREGKCKVEETERGWFVQWIDNSPEALARKEAILKKERQEMDDEQLEHKLLKEQIRRARNAETPASKAEATELKRDSQQPIKLSLKPKLGVAKTSAFKKPSVSPFAALQNANNANNAVQTKSVGASARKPVSAVDAIMHQELLKKDATGLQRHHNDRTRLRQHSRSRSPDNASCQDSPAVRRRSRSPQQQRRHR